MRPALITLSRNRESQQTTTTTPPRVPRQQRLPLQNRDHNALVMRAATPLSTRSGNAMPYDKQTLNVSTRPILGGAAVKATNKTPLTPRIAGSKTPATPRARHDGPPTPSQREGISTPVSTFLTNNITPRSSSRKSRVDSEHNTPTSSPAHEQLPRVSADTPVYNGGLGISGLDNGPSNRGPISNSPAASDLGSQRDQSEPHSHSTNDSKFFFASDAKTAAQAPRHPTLNTSTSTSIFIYANGETIAPSVSSFGSVVGSSIGDDRSNLKFFQPPVYFPPPSSTVSTSSHATSSRIGTQNTSNSPSLNQRPGSPQKVFDGVSFSSLKNVSTLSSPDLGRLANTTQSSDSIAPRVSIKTPPRTNVHEKSASAGSSTSIHPVQTMSSMVIHSTTSPIQSPNASSADCPRIPTEFPVTSLSNGDLSPELQSPMKTKQTLERMNELALNARRERKVLDLEITNSSLAAINRTLEREMRKQTAELRRFRRLSRSGRLSIAPTRVIVRGLSMTDGESARLSDMSEEDDDEYGDESSDDETTDEGSLSPRAMAESDARHREKDEMRLQLDLSKHQELLVDSQKMNQSLKRCLEWTEMLIHEGKKALAYHVHISDVQLGGRVLAPDEDEENDLQSQRQQDLPEIGAKIFGQAHIDSAIHGSWASSNKDDRDSGIEVDPLEVLSAKYAEEVEKLPP